MQSTLEKIIFCETSVKSQETVFLLKWLAKVFIPRIYSRFQDELLLTAFACRHVTLISFVLITF